MSATSFGPVARWLRTQGFKQIRAQASATKAFRGELICRSQPVLVRVEIADWDFVSYPKVFLESVPEVLKGFRPHVLSGGDLCYYTSGGIVLDRFKPAEAVARCLLRVQEALEELAGGHEFRFGAHDEFGLYWHEGSVYTGTIDQKKKQARLVYIESVQTSFYVLTQTGDEPEWLAHSVGGAIRQSSEIPVWIIETSKNTSVDVDGGLPTTIKATMEWIKRWDPTACQRLMSLLENRDYLAYNVVAFVFSSPVGFFGFFLELESTHRNAYRRKPARYRHYLFNKGARTLITRVYGVDISPEFVHTRNIQGNSLLGKKVAVIGCGAIGGYVAHALTRLGAGVGDGGRLTLIDYDTMQPGNLGRHVLGFRALALDKSVAIKKELEAQFPYANLRALKEDVRKYQQLFEEDLLIDTTGEESLSMALAYAHQQCIHGRGAPPLMHVWVAGNGEAAQALFVDGKKGGCYRCMWMDDPKIGMKDRMPLLKKPPATRFVGCQSVTMFPVSAAMSAAALASDIVI